MTTTLEDKLARLEDDRRARIESRAAELIAEAMARRELQATDVAPRRARGRQV